MRVMSVLQWFRKRVVFLILGGLLLCLIVLLIGRVTAGHAYQMRVAYVYPGAENGLYPDGQRLLREDLIKPECIEEALAVMRSKGWYTDLTVKQIQDNLSVREYLSNPVQAKVEALRAEGREYTYYNNEYIIVFKQPMALHLKDSTDFFGLMREDRSKEFVEALHRANVSSFLREHTEGNVFVDFSRYLELGTADYDQIIDIYTDKATLCQNYLRKKQQENNTFVSGSTGMSFDDLIIAYQALIDVHVTRLYKYTSSLKLTMALEERLNRYKVDIENLELHANKKMDEHDIAEGAMMEYDHTFSENIIIVAVNEENGLYQARPKTAYDTVTQQALNAGVDSSTARNTASQADWMIDEYKTGMSAPSVDTKMEAARQMASELYAEYDRLAKVTAATIDDYITVTNRNYIKTNNVPVAAISTGAIMKAGAAFVIGVCIAAALCVVYDRRRKSINA